MAPQRKAGLALTNLLVGNLPSGITEPEVRAFFERYGAVEQVLMVTDRATGRAGDMCFVDMNAGSEGAPPVTELDGADLAGNPLKVLEVVRLSGWRWGQ